MNTQLIEESIRNILCAIGEDPSREGLIETPSRVAKMFEEVFAGIQYTNHDIAKMFNKCFTIEDDEDLVLVKNIDAFSYCEHHMALMYNMHVSVAYIPYGKVIGLSKIARIVDLVCRRLQLQEKIGRDIAEILEEVLGVHDVMVVIEGEHSCMTARGIKKPGTKTDTATIRGLFRTNSDLRSEVYNLLK